MSAPYYEKQQVWRAGAIPYIIDEVGNVEMMFMIPSTTEYNKTLPELKMPQIAKGRVERFEKPYTAAVRECNEELGLLEENIARVIEGGIVLGRTHIYAFQVRNKTDFENYSSETEQVLWMSYDSFMTSGRELHKSVVDTLFNKIIEQYINEAV